MQSLVQDILLPLALFLMMTGMGLSLVADDFRQVARYPRAALLCLLSMLVCLPALGFVVASLSAASGVLAVGVVLVATCPGGMFSNLMTHLGGGNLALSISMTSIASLVYVFTIPFWASLAVKTFLGEEAAFGLPLAETLVPLVLFVLVPVAVGMAFRLRKPAFAERIEGRVKGISAFLVLLIFIYLSVVQEETLGENVRQVWMAVVALNLISVGIGAILAVAGRLAREDGIAVVIEHAIRQEGTAIYVAATLMGSPEAALPLMINSGVGMLITLGFLAAFGGRRPLVQRIRDGLRVSGEDERVGHS